jgi:cell division protein FtsI (penicillin-binding protein 3)
VQVIGNDFFQRQGEVRFARTLEMPASRGRISTAMAAAGVQRAGAQHLGDSRRMWSATSPGQAAAAGQAAGMPLAELNKKLADEDKTFVWLKRQVD